jgi:hypothetical protein
MSHSNPPKIVGRYFAVILAAALTTIALAPHVSAQTVVEPRRWLLVFDTSVIMKNWLPATTTEAEDLFISSMGGQLHEGDSVGVWTFDEKLHAAEYPQFMWIPTQAASAASDINRFLDHVTYLGKTKFAALEPALRHVIAHSQRLTIVIFCDGQDTFKLTPYDHDINGIFKQMKASRKKLQQPFVIAIRTQNGQFIGATVNIPPGNIDFPTFPPLPEEIEVVTTNSPSLPTVIVPPPVVVVPPLVIVGTNVITDTNELKKATGP